jgi:hypothetical protein
MPKSEKWQIFQGHDIFGHLLYGGKSSAIEKTF